MHPKTANAAFSNFAENSPTRVEHPLLGLHNWGLLDLRTEDDVPEFASNTEAVLVVEEVVFQMILLELLVPQWQVLMVQEVVCHVVAGVAKNATAVNCCRNVPIPEEDCVGERPERSGKNGEKRRRHNETVFVHGQIVMDTVQREMQCDTNAVVRKVTTSPRSVYVAQVVPAC